MIRLQDTVNQLQHFIGTQLRAGPVDTGGALRTNPTSHRGMTPLAIPLAIILTTDDPHASAGWLVLCDDSDIPSRWAYVSLCERGVPAELVPTSVLSGAIHWVHRVGPAGASAEVVLPDGE